MSKQQQLSILDIDKGNFGHGGKRQGSGRHKREETKVMRIPAGLVADVEQIIRKYRSS
ncbi:hypothetical protein [Vibrio sp. SCSIO 43136]|uniref:hypothetical protein n=1 Tax=Vibrio sp. SCSIO 43136 TaxID=2819101 RepID=UPI0020762E2B|nr:hypothetical protein [Vibrio sp. SCSIO 43136]USD68115.1 hypothetical protein J4N39_18240 [Vibrio sp. SCSIO 43136]